MRLPKSIFSPHGGVSPRFRGDTHCSLSALRRRLYEACVVSQQRCVKRPMQCFHYLACSPQTTTELIPQSPTGRLNCVKNKPQPYPEPLGTLAPSIDNSSHPTRPWFLGALLLAMVVQDLLYLPNTAPAIRNHPLRQDAQRHSTTRAAITLNSPWSIHALSFIRAMPIHHNRPPARMRTHWTVYAFFLFAFDC